MNLSSRLAGKVVLVTGAAGGIGWAAAERMAAEGATVWITDVESRSDDLAQNASSSTGDVSWFTLDVSVEQDWIAGVARVVAESGRIDALVNNAGIANQRTVEDETLEGWERILSVSQRGPWLGMKHAGPVMAANGGGSIVNVCSIFGTVGGFGASFSYHASKGALRTMTKNAALYWAPAQVRVNSFHPGFVASEESMRLNAGTDRERRMIAGTPLGRLGRPDEMSGAIAFLVSDDSTFVTGSELYADGGWTAQ